MVRMRDGVALATDVWIPDGQPAATLLVRLPYSKDLFPAAEIDYPTMPNIFRLLEAGYAIAYQDCRGTGRSEGRFSPLVHEVDDGADAIAWLRDQPWCDGRIGMFGHSYLGMTQWAAAASGVEGLKAIVPTITATDSYASFWYSPGGALSWHALWYWSNLMLMLPVNDVADSPRGSDVIVSEAVSMLENADGLMAQIPAGDQPLLAEVWPWWNEILHHSERDGYWEDRSPIERMSHVATPALHIGGWFDIFIGDMARTFAQASENAATAHARSGQRLIIGPWDHMHFTGEYLDRNFGVGSAFAAGDLTQAHLDFYDRAVREAEDGPELSPVRIFVMGIDEWRDEQSWPLTDTEYTEYFLSSSLGARTSEGDGQLHTTLPTGAGADTYCYDPDNPVPTLGGRVMQPASLNAVGPVDQRSVELRDDVLCFTSDVLIDALEVTGHVSAVLHIESSATDTDFTAKLVDVFPDGRAIYLTDGIIRARYRESLTDPRLMQPGQTYEVTIDMSVTSNVFLPGHRIRLEISSSNFPRYDRNSNTGEVPVRAGSVISAINTVRHGPEHPSRLVLPVITRASGKHPG